jgi:multiple sugar transport system substrate-binding protein
VEIKPDRRQFLMAGASAAILGTFADRAWGANVALRFAWWGGKARADRTQKAVNVYVSKNSGVAVSTEYLGWSDYWPRLSTETSGGNSPDIVQMSIDYLADYASRGVLLPLESLIPSPLNVSDFQADLLGNGKVNGKQYAIPSGVNAVALVIDKAAFEQTGVKPPDYNTTWEQFSATMAEFSKKTPRKGMFGAPDASGSEPVLETWLRQRGKQLYHPDRTLGYDAKDMTDWFQMWAEMRGNGGVASPDVQALDHGDVDNSLLSQGRSALAFENSNQYVAFQALSKDALVLAPYPKVAADSKGGLYVKPTMFYALSSQSKNAEAAVKLLDFILRDPQATAILGTERGIPASAEVRDRLKPSLDEAGKAMLDYIANLGDLAGTLPPANPPGGGEVGVTLLKASQEVAFGSKSPAKGATDYISDAKSILARAL